MLSGIMLSMNVLVLLGGNSPERDVSIRSGKGVAAALQSAGHTVIEYDPTDDYLSLGSYKDKVDCVFPILHGISGEDGSVQTLLEEHGFKYLGSDIESSKLCFNKALFKQELEKIGIDTPKWQIVNSDSIKDAPTNKPFVLKPISNGSAIDTYIIRNPEQQTFPMDVFNRYDEMLFEELIEGNEITVGILGSTALPVVEIIPPEGEEFDYENKYNGKTTELCPPKNVSSDKQVEAQKLTEKIHSAVNARHLSRTDMIIGKDGKIYVLDFNTMPGLTDQSLLPKAVEQSGLSMEQFVQKLLDLVLQ